MVRHRPIQGESNIEFLGDSEGFLPLPHYSFPDASAINDFWSMSGSFVYRHHVEPRVKLYSSREESFPIPRKYIDVSRTTHTNLDVKQEKRIYDYWNIDGSRDLSDLWKKKLPTDTQGLGKLRLDLGCGDQGNLALRSLSTGSPAGRRLLLLKRRDGSMYSQAYVRTRLRVD